MNALTPHERELLNPFKIYVAIVAGDDNAFRKFQQDLRASPQFCCVNSLEVMQPYLEARGEEVLIREEQAVQAMSIKKARMTMEALADAKKDDSAKFIPSMPQVTAVLRRLLKEDSDPNALNYMSRLTAALATKPDQSSTIPLTLPQLESRPQPTSRVAKGA